MRVSMVVMMITLMAGTVWAEKAIVLESGSEAVDKAVAAENLRAVAGKSSDAELLLGLGFVAPTGSAARAEILAKAVKAKAEFGPAAIVLQMAMDGVEEPLVAELIKSDADNALGYYLQAHLLLQAGKEQESLAAFRKGAACAEIRLYGTPTANALFKALDALGLKGRDRLAALSWTATRMGNFYGRHLQQTFRDLGQMTRKADLATRKEISDLLLVVGGQLYTTNFENRLYAQWAVESAFRMKAEIAAAEKSPTMNGYVTVVQALVSVRYSWPGIADRKDLPLDTAQYVPSRILGAFEVADPAKRQPTDWIWNAQIPEADRAAFEKAKKEAIASAAALIEEASKDPDEVIGAYLRGLPPVRKDAPQPWVSSPSYVEKLMSKRPEVFRAVAATEEAIRAMQAAGESDPRRRNMSKLMNVGVALACYWQRHNDALPESLEVLYKDGKLLDNAEAAKSVLTGRPYVYVGGKKLPEKEWESFLLAYDDKEQDGNYQCVMADGHGESMPVKQVEELVRKQRK